MKYYIGIDLGGTNIKAGVVNEKFEIIAKASTKTLCPRPAKDICADIARAFVINRSMRSAISAMMWLRCPLRHVSWLAFPLTMLNG